MSRSSGHQTKESQDMLASIQPDKNVKLAKINLNKMRPEVLNYVCH